MRLHLIGTVDSGCTFSLGSFKPEIFTRLQAADFPFCSDFGPHKEEYLGINLPFGPPCRFTFETKRAKAVQDYLDDSASRLGAAKATLFDTMRPGVDISFDLYPLGFGLLDISCVWPKDAPFDALIDVFQAFEMAAYKALSQPMRELLVAFRRAGDESLLVSVRHPPLRNRPDIDIISQFIFLVEADEGEFDDEAQHELLAALNAYEGQQTLTEIPLDDAIVHAGWACTLLVKRGSIEGRLADREPERAVYLLRLAQLAYICLDVFQRDFRDVLRRVAASVTPANADPSLDLVALRRVQITSLAVSEIVRFDTWTYNMSDYAYFEYFMRCGDVEKKQATLADLPDSLLGACANLAQELADRRSKRLNALILILTVCGAIASLTDIFNYAGIAPWHATGAVFRAWGASIAVVPARLLLVLMLFVLVGFIWVGVQALMRLARAR